MAAIYNIACRGYKIIVFFMVCPGVSHKMARVVNLCVFCIRAKTILIKNQYPAPFFEKIIHDTLPRIFKPEERALSPPDTVLMATASRDVSQE